MSRGGKNTRLEMKAIYFLQYGLFPPVIVRESWISFPQEDAIVLESEL